MAGDQGVSGGITPTIPTMEEATMTPHELECALAAYVVQIEKFEKERMYQCAKVLRKEMNELIRQHRPFKPEDLPTQIPETKEEALRIGRIQFKSAGATRKR